MPLKLSGSCQCGTVRFSLQSSSPVPYQLCLCSICRKLGASGGAINLGGIASTLEIHSGKDKLKIYRAVKDRGTAKEEQCTSERNFCSECGTMLWLFSPEWPELIHPFATAIDTPLPEPEEMTVIMTDSAPAWVRLPDGKKKTYKHYGTMSIEEWHKKHGQWVE